MKAVIASPVRVHAEVWADYRAASTRAFAGVLASGTTPDGWQVCDGTPLSIRRLAPAGDVAEAGTASFADDLFASLASTRRNVFALRPLAPEAGRNTCLIAFETGDALVLEALDLPRAPEERLHAIDAARDSALDLVRPALPALHRLIQPKGALAEVFDADLTHSHTIFICAPGDAEDIDVARQAFALEGLPLDTDPHASVFLSGWSFSAVQTSDHHQAMAHVALMARLQCAWFTTRINRDYCLRTLREVDIALPVVRLVQMERTIVARRTQLRLWQHEQREFRANLTPDLTDAADRVEALWETDDALKEVQETLAQARENLQSSYGSRLLIQERRQSFLLAMLTAIGVLGISSTASGMWLWLTRAEIYDNSQLATATGQRLVLTGLGAVFALALTVFVVFLILRLRRT